MNIVSQHWSLPDFDAVIWDKDGTITDAHSYWGKIIIARASRIVQKLREQGKKVPIMLSYYLAQNMGLDMHSNRLFAEGPIAIESRGKVIQIVVEFLKEEGFPNCAEIVLSAFDEVQKELSSDLVYSSKVLPGVSQLIGELCVRYIPQILLTSDSRITTVNVLQYHGLLKYFTAIYGREDFPMAKNSGESCRDIIARHGLKPATTIAIGDTTADIEMARNAGIRCISVASGQIPQVILASNNDFTVPSLTALCLQEEMHDE